ncbi:peptidase S8/S53 subtilisin kexin sedolisin [Halovivax asiaticus JCM 14624]|uniref:Peptidase S8/S53 subtilisin kexin sedolisin n=1 Tax=Halovivax asiaticus JCM 14624 TaxID=1227490 RepID=M0BTI8_9EURY|nr:S8 family serine peptidase [Halovivax asiaticus]ELZ14270.1 peptidase S8/S53 subtilisin kexin sedolisin [Halovivax asiaticus JCM 14624]
MTHEHSGQTSRRTVLKSTAATGAFLGLGSVVSATPGREPGPKEDEILVGKTDTVGLASARSTVESAIPSDASVVHENETLGYMAVKVADDGPSAMDSVIDRLERQPGVEYAERNVTLEAFYEPNDPQFGDQYAPQLVNAPQAWDTTTGSSDVTIAVVDTGAQYDHEDLAAQYRDDPGYDFADDDSDPYPPSGEQHGTHVSGCAAATIDNGTGTAGISDSTLINARVLGGGSGSLSDIADGIQWAADEGADIINLSLGGGGANETGRSAINYAFENGTLPIAAAGNDSGSPVSYPAAYENCVAVSAIDENENIASFSNVGPNIDVASPGVGVLAPVPTDGYASFDGTSMASPVAAGVAALGKATHPDHSPSELRQLLEETAVDIGLSSDEQGNGRVDAANIVEGGGQPDSPTASFGFSPSDPEADETVTFDASGSSAPDGGSISGYEWDFGDGSTASGVTADHRFASEGDYSVELTVTAGNGNTDTSTQTVAVGGDGGGGQCGAETSSDSVSGSLSGGWWGNGSDSYTYTLDTANPCQATVTLSGPSSADFDLFLTLDGRTPTTSDYDEASTSPDSQEEITVDLSGGEELGLLVDAYSGSGSYTMTVDELGK